MPKKEYVRKWIGESQPNYLRKDDPGLADRPWKKYNDGWDKERLDRLYNGRTYN
jgi:hypothetical protein